MVSPSRDSIDDVESFELESQLGTFLHPSIRNSDEWLSKGSLDSEYSPQSVTLEHFSVKYGLVGEREVPDSARLACWGKGSPEFD